MSCRSSVPRQCFTVTRWLRTQRRAAMAGRVPGDGQGILWDLPPTRFMPPAAHTLQESYRQLVRYCALACVLAHAIFIGVFAMHGVHVLAALNVLSVAAHAYAYWQSRPQGNMRHAGYAVGLEVTLHAASATVIIGWNSGFHYLMIPVVPVAMLSTTLPYRYRLLISSSTTLIYLALLYWSQHHPPMHPLPDHILLAMQYGCVFTLLGAFMAMARRYREVLAHTQEALAREASTDPLTGALNRRRLHQLAEELPRHADGAVLLCDLDDFKQVNDRHGHDAGDAVLRAFHRQLLGHLRDGDQVCRWGGEEFLVLLPRTSAALAGVVAQRICASVAQTPVRLGPDCSITVTVTIGVASLQTGEPLQQAVQRADEALYRGKAGGRNQVQHSPAQPPGADAAAQTASAEAPA